MVKITIEKNDANQRLDRFLRKFFKKASLSAIYKMIRKDIKVNGKRAKEDTMLSEGDELQVYITEERLNELTADIKKKVAKRQFKIAYEDEDVLIVDKPKGLLTHGDAFEKKNTLANQVCGYLQEKGEYIPSREKTFVPAPVNRLDRNTTGLVMFGKNSETLRLLTKSIREHENIEKYYMTIVCGKLQKELFLSDRLKKDGIRNVSEIASEGEGKSAETIVKPVVVGEKYSLVEVRILTGRTHQIRVHLANAGFPLAGDIKYGNPKNNAELKKLGVTTQLLHAYKLRFAEGKEITAELPEEFKRIKRKLILPDDRKE